MSGATTAIRRRPGWNPSAPAVWLGLCLGLSLPLFLTLRADRALAGAAVAVPVGLLVSIGLHFGLARCLGRMGVPKWKASHEAVRVLAPLWIVALAPLALTIPARNLPAYLVFVALGLCLYRLALLARTRLFAARAQTLERLVFLMVFVGAWVALFRVHIVHDAFQYYGYLVSLALDGDLDLYEQIYLHNAHRSYNPFPAESARYIGTAVMEAPFFAVGHVTAALLNVAQLQYPPNGYSLPYRFFVSLASGLFGLAGVVFCYLLAREFFSRVVAMMATLALWLASPLVFFMFSWGGWAHPFAFFFASAFLLLWIRTRGDRTIGQWLALGVLAGFLCLIRPSSGALFVFPLAEWVAGIRGGGSRQDRLRQLLIGPGLGALASLLVFSPQLSLWNATSGSWLAAPYKEVGDHHDWLHPDFSGLLFSTAQHGLFVWSPLLLLAAVGLFFLWRRDRFVAGCSALTLTLTIYLFASWSIWWSGVGFSNRFFIGSIPLFVLGLGAAIQWLSRRSSRELIWAVLLLAIGWNLTLAADYRSNILPQGIPDPSRVVDDPLTPSGLVLSNLGLASDRAEGLWGSDWIHDGFVTERVANWFTFGNADGALAVLAAIAVMVLLAHALLRLALARPGRWTGHRLPLVLLTIGVVVTASLHLAIASAARRTAPNGEFFHFEETSLVARQPGEDVVLYPDYDVPVTSVDLLSFLIYGHEIPQGAAVAAVTVYDESGRGVTEMLRAGIHTAETSYLRPEYRSAIRHDLETTTIVRDRPTHVYSSRMYDLLTFRAELELPAPMVVSKLRIRYLRPVGRLVVSDIFLRGH